MKKGKARVVRSRALGYVLGKTSEEALLNMEFGLALKRTVAQRMRRGFINTYKPVIDDAPYRIFHRRKEYVQWCEQALPGWLGYGKAR